MCLRIQQRRKIMIEQIKSTGYDQHKILADILALHCNNQPIDADVTYSKGEFYSNGIARPKLCFDLVPRFDYVIKADCCNLLLPDGQLKIVVSDPPFGIGSGPSMLREKEGQNIIINRFSVFRTGKELFDFYEKMLAEMYRILSVGGILIQKIQPVVACGKQWMTHYHVMAVANKLGFYHKDEFILLAKARLISGKIKKQQHARKYHSYFYVFEKR